MSMRVIVAAAAGSLAVLLSAAPAQAQIASPTDAVVTSVAVLGSSDRADSGEQGSVGVATLSQLHNRGLPGNWCLANRHPKVFMWECNSSYKDQRWTLNGKGQLVNAASGKCLAMHANGHVFTHTCTASYTDQRWYKHVKTGGYQYENKSHHGNCLAAHNDREVFGWRCDNAYPDQR
ncbi:hypothetical protein GCM10022243_67330 [Saccharothrix violaceirubra]|uniref:Ricin B lectin domain-containing protein n=1 Tax=Saccharothrix violaceirubra TaxID=413306 RepID=A0A7W7WVH1_9PSEU|nr:ricin-type beta-trefoil lectin domain protein [Saccharothrix violaceirubra]MBB4965315.1 hypothetical protein [Saccharothrix violaceirubra]